MPKNMTYLCELRSRDTCTPFFPLNPHRRPNVLTPLSLPRGLNFNLGPLVHLDLSTAKTDSRRRKRVDGRRVLCRTPGRGADTGERATGLLCLAEVTDLRGVECVQRAGLVVSYVQRLGTRNM